MSKIAGVGRGGVAVVESQEGRGTKIHVDRCDRSLYCGIGDNRSFMSTFMLTLTDIIRFTDHAVLLSVVMQLGTLYQQPLVTCLHHHLVSTAVSRLNYLPGLMALTHCSTLVIA